MRAKIEVDVRELLDDIGLDSIFEMLRHSELSAVFGRMDPKALGDLLKQTMSPEALAELKAALS